MSNEYQIVGNMVDEIKGTTGFLSKLMSRKFGLITLFIIVGVIASKMFL
jgi:hypothetical protein